MLNAFHRSTANATAQQNESEIIGKKRKREQFIYGNYHFYYGYRIGQTLNEDPRLQIFRKKWFKSRDCLDIGCNEGCITIAIAERYHCRSMLGVDIDPNLISKAQKNLEGHLSGYSTSEQSYLEKEDASSAKQCKESRSYSKVCGLGDIVSFRTENYLETSTNYNAYDTILCLSVTKWIHLNWGDDGLIKFFKKILEELRPNGFLVLEPQPWISYKKKYNVSEVTKRNYKEVLLRPENFPELLINQVGFKSFREITSATHSTTGFNRPVFLYYKSPKDLGVIT